RNRISKGKSLMYPPARTGATASVHTIVPPLNLELWRETLTYLLVGLLVLLVGVGVVVAYHCSVPQAQWVTLGDVDQFPPAQPVRVDIGEAVVWVVNLGEDFIVLRAIANDPARCRIDWEVGNERFADPCRGTRYTMAGIYALNGPPPFRA